MEEFFKAEELQRIVWGREDTEDPADLMMVIQHEGGLVGGAFDGDQLMGYVFGFPTRVPEVQHSHRLAVHPAARGSGLAVQLKRFQRSWCLQRGIDTVRWTFDPLRHVNANLNVKRLGVEIATYYPDYYGVMKGINAGLASDRLLAEWKLNDPTVVSLAADEVLGVTNSARPAEGTTVSIPKDIDHLIKTDLNAAIAARLRVREKLTQCFEQKLVIRGYDAQQGEYHLSPRPRSG